MEAAVGAAGWLLGKLLTKLSDDLVAAFVASTELGHNFKNIKRQLLYTQGLLDAAQGRDFSTNPSPGLQGLLDELGTKAVEAEDMLDEVHYFMIQDELDGTHEATVQEPAVPEMGDVIRSHARDGRHAARHTFGNWLPCFSCSRTQHDDPHSVESVDAAVVTSSSNPQNATKSASGNDDGGSADKLSFDRVDMSNRIKSVIEEMNSICGPVSELLKIANQSSTPASTAVSLKRPPTGSTMVQDKLFGRSAIFEQTINTLTGSTYHTETLSVLPIVGPGGIGKTTFTQHLYNDKRTEGHFTVKVWVCVSTDFDVLELTRQIRSCIPAIEKEENNIANETANLDQLQKSIAERLKSKRFLLVLDDIWKCSSEADWKNLLSPFTKGETKGNMVIATTRFPFVANMVKTTAPIELRGLESNDFLEFFEACIFGNSKPAGHYVDDLIDIARDIARELKGSPLAANTVGRLLSKVLSQEYWMGVLEKNEWQNTKNDDDIMPSLKISYDYLPFYLKKCFSYCSLFPEDHRFRNLEITGFWRAIGIINISSQNDENYLDELVENGFLMKGDDHFGQYYVMHDLLHELSQNVSSQECVNISSLSFSANSIPQSIRHLSITIKNICDESFEEEMGKLKSRIDIGNLRTMMIFGLHDVRIANILKDTFEETKALRVLFIAMNFLKSLPINFSNLIHLQYIKISSPYDLEMTLPSTLSGLYHLKILDLKHWHGSENIDKDFSRLVNLRHFRSSKKLHSNIPEVGKMKCLEELKEFYVKKENVGFELKQLGELTELAGKLSICNLETVKSKGEASGAKLKNKRNLKELRLVWGTEHHTVNDDVLDGLHPPHNLKVLRIINPGVGDGPSWLYGDIGMKMLVSLHLEGMSRGTLPPFEQLLHLNILIFKNFVGMREFGLGSGGVTEKSFMHLKEIVFENMPELVEWVGGPNNPHQFSRLETIKCRNCPLLRSFPFLKCSDLFTKLCTLDIANCPELSQFHLMPHTSTLTYIHVKNDKSELLYDGKKLTIERYTNTLAFHKMDRVELMEIIDVSQITLFDLQKLNSLRSVDFKRCDNMFSVELDDIVVLHKVQNLHLQELSISRELFSKVLRCFPAISQLTITKCENLELLPHEGGGLSNLKMLQSFTGSNCGKLFSQWVTGEVGGGAHAIKPFPTSLRELKIFLDPSMQSMGLLSNLTSLTSLHLKSCKRLTMDGFNPLITVNLKKLSIDAMSSYQEYSSIADGLLSEIARSRLMHADSFQLEEFRVDSISAMLTAPVCSHLTATLHRLVLSYDQQVTAFTKQQEQALQLLTSLQFLQFHYCLNLRSLPQLRGLSSLKTLLIHSCKKIMYLPPKEGLPTSLKNLQVWFCSRKVTKQAENLKGEDPWFPVNVLVMG